MMKKYCENCTYLNKGEYYHKINCECICHSSPPQNECEPEKYRVRRRLEIEREKGRKELEDEIREGLGKRWDLYTKDDILEFLERRNLYRATPETKK